MNIATNIIFVVIFGIIGFIVKQIWDFDPYEYWTRFGTASIGISLLIVYLPAVFNPSDGVNNIMRLMNWFVAVLPGVIAGDFAGQVLVGIFGGRKDE
jgi:hypothetical protein